MLSIKFVDGELVKNVDWNSIPNDRVIRYMDYKIGNETIRLMGFERYLRLKEMAQGVNVKFNAIIKVILIGQTGITCTKVILDLINKKCSKEKVPIETVTTADKFWRPGQILDNPGVFINHG